MADINTDQRFDNVALSITNAQGQPAQVEQNSIVWASSDETVVKVAAAADGMSAVIDTVAPGTARVTVTADADVGAGTTTLTGVTEDINVTLGPSSQASLMTLTLGAPVNKTP